MTEHRCEKMPIEQSIYKGGDKRDFWCLDETDAYNITITILYSIKFCPFCGANLEAQKEKEK